MGSRTYPMVNKNHPCEIPSEHIPTTHKKFWNNGNTMITI